MGGRGVGRTRRRRAAPEGPVGPEREQARDAQEGDDGHAGGQPEDGQHNGGDGEGAWVARELPAEIAAHVLCGGGARDAEAGGAAGKGANQLWSVDVRPPYRRRKLTDLATGVVGACAVSRNGQWAVAVADTDTAPTLVFVRLPDALPDAVA